MLALVGSGEYLAPMEPVDRALIDRLGESPQVVCLPTAAGQEGQDRVRYWSELGEAHFTELGVPAEALPVVDRLSALNERWAERIRSANFVYLSGGRPEYLYHTLADTPVWEAIQAVDRAGGVVAGCSAGAMILGECIPGFLRWRASFGLLPGAVIAPHFDELSSSLIRVVRLVLPSRYMLVGIEGNTALLVAGSERRVIGSGGVVLWHGRTRRRFAEGEIARLPGEQMQ